MSDPLVIREMRPADIGFAADCTAREGWASETRVDFEGFYAHDSGGCLVAERQGKAIGIAVATSYGEFAFVGEIIVDPVERGRGIGRALLDRTVAYLRARGARSICLDGVVAAVPLYERAGFRKICRSLRFVRTPDRDRTADGDGAPGAARAGHGVDAARAPAPPAGGVGSCEAPVGGPRRGVRAMRSSDIESVCALDRQAFGADRSYFLSRRFLVCPELCWARDEGGRLSGFLLGRRGQGVVSAGPWLSPDGVESPGEMLVALLEVTPGLRAQVGVLERNERAVSVIRSLGFEEKPAPPWRMVLGPSERLGMSNDLLAIGSAAKG